VRIVAIDSADDERVRDFTSLTDVDLRVRREPAEGLFIAESARVVQRAIAAGFVPRCGLSQQRWVDELRECLDPFDIDMYVGDEAMLRTITGYRVHRGALVSMQRKPLPALPDVLATAKHVLVLEDIVEPTNVGAIFRSAAALGIDAVLVTAECADPLYRRAVKVSMGGVFTVPWTRITPWPQALDDVRAEGFRVLALSPGTDATDIARVDPGDRWALLLGTEGDGLTPGTMTRSDDVVRIPMHRGVDSLNVAAASAVACFALLNRPDSL
jgi:tRNA G18 (ribose-2'-O)-methylase SpoU